MPNDKRIRIESTLFDDAHHVARLIHPADSGAPEIGAAGEAMVATAARRDTLGPFDANASASDAAANQEHQRHLTLRDVTLVARENARTSLHAARGTLAAAGPRPSAPSGVVVALGGLVVTGLACGHPVSHVVAALGTPAWEAAIIGTTVGVAAAVLPVSVMLRGCALDTTFDRAAWGSLVVGSALSVALFELGTSDDGLFVATALAVVLIATLAGLHLAATDLRAQREASKTSLAAWLPKATAVGDAERAVADLERDLAVAEVQIKTHMAAVAKRDEEAARVESRAVGAEAAVKAAWATGQGEGRARLLGHRPATEGRAAVIARLRGHA